MASTSPARARSTMCGCYALGQGHPVERPPSGLQARTTMCGRCGTYLSVPRGARSVCCALCHGVTRVHGRPSGLQDFLKGLIHSLISPPEPPPSSEEDCLPDSFPRVSGRKRALLVGIGYTGRTEYELKGTVNDVLCMSYLLHERFGFPSDSILVLTEEEKDPNLVPTRKNLRLAMRWLVQGCDTGDALSLVFHFSGHGFEDGLYAVDFEDGGVIPKYEINDTIVKPLGPGVKLHAVVDTSHAGGTHVLDLRYLCRISRAGYWQWENHQSVKAKGTNGGLAISISGCRDYTQNPATHPAGSVSPTGATHSFIEAVETEPGTTYGRLILAIRAKTRREPQLGSTEAFDIYRKPLLL